MSKSTLVKYGSRSTVGRWFDEYWTEPDKAAGSWLIFLLIVFYMVAGTQLILWVVSFFPVDLLGNSGASIRAHQMLVAIAAGTAVISAAAALKIACKPMSIEMTEDWLRLRWPLWIRGEKLNWRDVTEVSITTQPNRIGTGSYMLRFATANNPDGLKLPLHELESVEQRQSVIDAFSTCALKASIHPDVYETLVPPKALSFAEIWLDALAAAPGRERLVPLTQGTILETQYEICKHLGAGGQGTVYLAKDSQSGGNVVLKETILPVYADLITRRQALESFHKEAQALESVKSANIVKFLGSFVSDHRGYLVLEYIDGKPLSQVIKEAGPMAAADAAKFGIRMCEMLAVLHDLKPPMVHRDFTPDNLMLKTDSTLMLIDFAVAVAAAGEAEDTAGKASYMAPEQFKGKPTHQSDIYSLGCTLYYMLTGQHPGPLQESNPIFENDSVPLTLSNLVAKCTKPNASDRPANVHALKSELSDVAKSCGDK